MIPNNLPAPAHIRKAAQGWKLNLKHIYRDMEEVNPSEKEEREEKDG